MDAKLGESIKELLYNSQQNAVQAERIRIAQEIIAIRQEFETGSEGWVLCQRLALMVLESE